MLRIHPPPFLRLFGLLVFLGGLLSLFGCTWNQTSQGGSRNTPITTNTQQTLEAFWIGETRLSVNRPANKYTWTIRIVRGRAKVVYRKVDQELPAAGAKVQAELRSEGVVQPLEGVVGADGVVAWMTERPRYESGLFVLAITGDDASWSAEDVKEYQSKPVLSFQPN